MSSRRTLLRRCIAAFLAAVACIAFVGSPLMTRRANAQAVTVVGNVPDDIERVLDEIFTQLLQAGTVALFNAAQTFLGQLAYDAATYVASGGKGQNALTQAKDAGSYFQQVGEDALGSAIGSLSDEFFKSNLGFDLCKPPNPENLLNLQVSLGNFLPQASSGGGRLSRPRPSCDFQQVVDNYDQFFTTLTSMDLLKNINASFNTNASDIGASVQIFGRTAAKVSYDYTKAAQTRKEDGAFKSVTDVVSGNVKTPASVVSASTKEQLVAGPKRDEGAARNAILSSAADQGITQLAVYTASMFISTLGSKLLGRIMEKGLIEAFDFSDLDQQTNIASTNPDAIPSRSREDARRANLSLRDVNLIRTTNIETLSQLIACPDVRGTWNCAMDQQLAQAVRGSACDNGSCTIGKALGQGLMKGDWRLYPDSFVRQNQDRDCYQQAYCSGNVRKLRLMRILPVGFEFAANSDANIARCAGSEGCVTLQEVVDGFSDCSVFGERDADHPWCKLIDPGWVITSFEQQCKLSGYSDDLISSRLGQRQEECRDIQTCLKRNDKGECIGGYGYCVAEKTVYRFKGDECSQQAASCRNFSTRAGKQVSYLRNTLDYGQCSADNVGCLAYSTARQPDATWISSAENTMYFDRTLSPCSASDEGCTRLLAAEVGGSSLNLLSNGSFERTDGPPLALSIWSQTPAVTYAPVSLPAGSTALDGTQVLALSTGIEYFQRVAASPGRVMTLSLFARVQDTGDVPSLNATVSQYVADGSAPGREISGAYAGSSALFKSPTCIRGDVDPAIGTADGSTYGTNWLRFQCSFVTTDDTRFIEIRVTGDRSFVDAIQLEDGQYATAFTAGANKALPVVYMKTASDDFACTGAETDPEICGKFAKTCRQLDAGCQGYTDNSSAPEVPAILSTNDLCPSECVGYAEYRKQASGFDLVVDADPNFSDRLDEGKAYFIPSTATQCTQQDVGCEVFTNLEAAASGGEQTGGYSYLRLCKKPDPNLSKTYFTWEGSESTGYQLRTWSLMSDPLAAPGEVGTGPQIKARRGPDGEFKLPSDCNASTWRTGLDQDCRQFYDRDGNVFYRFFTQTVLSSEDCLPLRIGARVSEDDCTNTGGSFNVSTGECVYEALPTESRSCNVQFAGCRAYAGSGSGASFLVVNENFRGGVGVFTGGAPSAESLLVGDQSLRLQSGAGSGLTTYVSFPSTQGDLFRVSFWAKGAGPGMAVQLKVSDAALPAIAPVAVGTATLSGDWQQYSFGLFSGYPGVPTSSLSWTLTGADPMVFIDEVRVERVRDTAYVVRDSWNTPATCDQTFSGIPEPQAMLGCRQYTDRFQNQVNAAKFTRLCREEAVGCRAFVDTRNSESSESQSFFLEDDTPVARRTFASTEDPVPTPETNSEDFFPSTTTTRPADRMLYLIYDKSKLCQSENMSCRAFGKPEYSIDKTDTASFKTVYYKDDIMQYGQALCRPSEEFCEEFSYLGANDYFKDPVDQTCEYKEGVRLSSSDFSSEPAIFAQLGGEGFAEGLYSGWFRKTTKIPCYPSNLQGGNFFGLPRRGDVPYQNWVGLCKPADGECTEFRDPNDTSDPQFRTGKPYFFVDNSKLDKTTCGGNADQAAGCILLRNQTDPILQYSSRATDLAYRANNFNSVQPINCDLDTTNPYCANRCIGKKITDPPAGRLDGSYEEDFEGAACEIDTDGIDNCATLYEDETVPGVGTVTYDVTCETPKNDANSLLKVNTDRDCAQWLGCESAETVFDPATSQYKDVCTNLALCDKSTDTPGEIFCKNYVDRNDRGQEPIFTQGKFFDIADYSSRNVGLGEKDYSGFSIPDSFQIPDTVTTRVGVDGALTAPNNENRFAQDYRLAAIVHIPVDIAAGSAITPAGRRYPLVTTPGPNEASALDTATLGRANPGLNLCQHVTTGIVGYYRDADREAATGDTSPKPFFNCYLPLRRDSDAYNFQNVVGAFGLEDPRIDSVLTKAFPAPECRSNPEADSPFPSSFVTEWDFTKNPPVPISKFAGYVSAKTCEYGEDCSCSYKRADYEIPTLTKFYSPLSPSVPPGVCFGGPRNGQSCLPSAILPTNVGSAALQQGISAANEQQLCGPPEQGGRCIAATKIEVIRGVFGQCLERDTTRILGQDRSNNPCLTWDPNPILFGDKDPFHYQPTSGYFPPQNSGQYYCTSPSKQPISFKLSADHFRRFEYLTPYENYKLQGDSLSCPSTADTGLYESYGRTCDPPFNQGDFQGGLGSANLDHYELQFDQHQNAGYYVGRMSRIDYGPQWLEGDNRCSPNECDYMSASIVEAHPINHYPTADYCSQAYGFTGGDQQGHPWPNAVRLVDAGNGYTETFFRINDFEFAKSLGASLPLDYDRFLSDNVLGYLRATPSQGGGAGLLGCGYQAPWADNMPSIDYTSVESIRQGERQWRDELARNYSPYMTRGNEQILASGDSDTSPAIEMDCVPVDNIPSSGVEGDAPVGTFTDNPFKEAGGEKSRCYFKYWETGYKNTQEKKQFEGIYAPGSSSPVRDLEGLRRHPIIAQCGSAKPYFAIRAVFQSRTVNTTAERTESGTVRANEVQGPWRFVGFWVTACAGASGDDQRYIYMDIEAGAANVCTELAEVQSSGSRQDAAFTDRVWSQSGFTEQSVGTSYGDAASPFSSAINTGPAGKDPLFQTGQELAGFSPLNPPIFLQSGVTTYYRNAAYPRDKWAYLTNLFARIYRIYTFRYDAVKKTDLACLSGPFKGNKCNAESGPVDEPDPACNIDGQCRAELMTSADLSSTYVCNRGPEKGIQCSVEEECKAPSFRGSDNKLHPLLEGCLMLSGWTVVEGTLTSPDAKFNPPPDSSLGTNLTRQQAADNDAFLCSGLSVQFGQSCTIPTGTFEDPALEIGSVECPTKIDTAQCRTSAGGGKICHFPRSIFNEKTGFVIEPAEGDVTIVNGSTISCSTNEDCNYRREDFNAATCGPATAPELQGRIGRCDGGLRAGQSCIVGNNSYGSAESCNANYGTGDEEEAASNSCGKVVDTSGNSVPECEFSSGAVTNPDESDPDKDSNLCTHSSGYVPRLDLCPNPKDEYCGLIAYKIDDLTTGFSHSMDPVSRYPLPTDVTLGHYTPTYLGLPSSASVNASTFAYITYYTPRPPRVAAPDTRNCPAPGQCPISRLDTIAFDGLTDGVVMTGGGQHKASLRFYAWAAHNQMPLRQVVVDWGDGQSQTLDDAKLKNRKPFCGVQKECTLTPGLTCQTNADCPPGSGTCAQVGVCANSPEQSCSNDAECTVGEVKDRCQIRTMFGNASDACQQDYFDFAHVYTCGADEKRSLPICDGVVGTSASSAPPGQCYFGSLDGFLPKPETGVACTGSSSTDVTECENWYTDGGWTLPASRGDWSCGPTGDTVATRCSRDPARSCSSINDCAPGDQCIASLAPPDGCFDTATNSCRFTPRIMLQDNWGWCTGECRNELVGGNLEDRSDVTVKHPYGGCYVGNVFNGTQDSRTRFNTRAGEATNESTPRTLPSQHNVTGSDGLTGLGECRLSAPGDGINPTQRPWIVYQGSLQLRRSDEIVR